MTEILAMEKRREVLKILLFVTRPNSPKEIHSPSSTVQMFPGRRELSALKTLHTTMYHTNLRFVANFDTLLAAEIENKMGTMAVTVCGSGSLSDVVRRAVRQKQSAANVDFIEEAFSW
jgi:hypothetical protein